MRVKINKIEDRRTTEEINQSKVCFLKNIKKIDKPLARWRIKMNEITKIRNEKGNSLQPYRKKKKGMKGNTMENCMYLN